MRYNFNEEMKLKAEVCQLEKYGETTKFGTVTIWGWFKVKGFETSQHWSGSEFKESEWLEVLSKLKTGDKVLLTVDYYFDVFDEFQQFKRYEDFYIKKIEKIE